MASTIPIVNLDRSHYAAARRALGRAFFDYPLMVYAAADPRRRAPAVTFLYNAILWDSFRWGEIHTTPDVPGVCCWLPPDKSTPGFWRQARSGMLQLPLRFGLGGFRRLVDYDNVARQLHHDHAPMPHYYLSAIGIDPEHQGQGIGSALMQPMLARADEEKRHCWLDTHKESNVRLYERHGFAIARRVEPPGHPVPVWGMLRRPR